VNARQLQRLKQLRLASVGLAGKLEMTRQMGGYAIGTLHKGDEPGQWLEDVQVLAPPQPQHRARVLILVAAHVARILASGERVENIRERLPFHCTTADVAQAVERMRAGWAQVEAGADIFIERNKVYAVGPSRTPWLSFADAKKALRWEDSLSRLPLIVAMRRAVAPQDWWRLLGEFWTACDNIAQHAEELRPLLARASAKNIAAMMKKGELARRDSLPRTVTVYRGCYGVNAAGLSWSLNQEVAARFPTLSRYRREGDTPLLVTGRVSRTRAVLKLDRSEDEMICSAVRVVDVRPLC
jgi:hypothetical protein